MNIDAASATIGVQMFAQVGVSTNLGAKNDTAVFHLTKGFNSSDPTKNAAAFRFDGQVKIALRPGESLQGFEIGFLQFVRFNFVGIFFAGPKSRDGSIGILIHSAMSQRVALDSNPTLAPFISEQHFKFADGAATNSMGDHPFFQVPQIGFHDKKGVNNFLFHVVDDRDFWSVFSVRDNLGKFRHLAHIQWSVRHDVKFNWRNKKDIQVALNNSTFKQGPVTLGPPPEPDLLGLLADPKPPAAATLLPAAFPKAVLPPNPFRSDNPTHFAGVPGDFFL